jgi:hypothetical protein
VVRGQRAFSLVSIAALLTLLTIIAAPGQGVHALGISGAYVALPPTRILDTRDGTGGFPQQPLGPDQTMDVQVAGRGGVPLTATAAVLNVTVTDTTAPSYLTVYPTGAARPTASNLNWVTRQTIPNLVEVGLGTDGKVSIYNAVGNVDVIFDVGGYVTVGLSAGEGLYNPLVPARILDSRTGTGVPAGALGPNSTVTLQVAGRGNVPAAGASGVVLNVTATEPTTSSYLTVYPSDQPRPVVSNLNFVARQTIANRVIVKLSSDGKLSFYNPVGSVHVIADVSGWFTDASSVTATGSTFTPLTPARILDTRFGGYLLNQQAIPVQVAGQGGVPAMSDLAPPNAVVANVTVTEPTQASYLTLWPDTFTQPVASDLNFSANQTIPSLVVVGLSASGVMDVYNAAGCTHLIVDVIGYYTGPIPPAGTGISGAPNCTWPPPPPPPPPPPQGTCGAPSNPWGYNFCDANAGKYIYSPPSNFCSYFSCIASFWQSTNGWVVECNDTKYSHSGGVSGACSTHGGPWRALWGP